ncbi:MAG: hypothetical protein ACMXX7_02955 [Candidatus Woesearchaeota archaeon]
MSVKKDIAEIFPCNDKYYQSLKFARLNDSLRKEFIVRMLTDVETLYEKTKLCVMFLDCWLVLKFKDGSYDLVFMDVDLLEGKSLGKGFSYFLESESKEVMEYLKEKFVWLQDVLEN